MSETYPDKYWADDEVLETTVGSTISNWVDKNYQNYPYRGRHHIWYLAIEQAGGFNSGMSVRGVDYDISDSEIQQFSNIITSAYRVYRSYDEWYEMFRWAMYHTISPQVITYNRVKFTTTRELHNQTRYPHTYIRDLCLWDDALPGTERFLLLQHGASKWAQDTNVDRKSITTYAQVIEKPSIDYWKSKRIITRKRLWGNPSTSAFTRTFIEHMKNPISPQKTDFEDSMKERLILFYSWDKLTFDEFLDFASNTLFLKSTRNLIGQYKIKSYLKKTFKTKQNLFDGLLQHLELDNEQNKSKLLAYSDQCFFHSQDFFNYFLFENEFKRSIRIAENKMRLDLNFRAIGTLYNEDILFQRIHKQFSAKYKVISQGTPSWLKPQRFDIFFPDLNIAIEYQGEQHFRPVDFGGKGKRSAIKAFNENQKRDEIKRNKCRENNCVLFEVKYNDDIDAFLVKLQNYVTKMFE
jgi:hypothetical protein